MNFTDLINSAKASGVDVATVQASGERFVPVDGEEYVVTPVLARAQLTKNGKENIGVHFEVVDGPSGSVGKKFWHNWYFTDAMSAEFKQANAVIVDAVGVVLGGEVNFDGSELPVTPAMTAMTAKYGKDDFPKHVFLPVADEGYTSDDDDNDDIDF